MDFRISNLTRMRRFPRPEDGLRAMAENAPRAEALATSWIGIVRPFFARLYALRRRVATCLLYTSPGLPDHPQHELAKRQMSGFGAMITFETGSLKNANKMLKRLRVCSLGESLGGVETLISHPATMTHAALGVKGRKAIGITDGMVRISVGIEDLQDIIADLEVGLAAM